MGQEEHKLGLETLKNIKNGKITRHFFDFQYIIGKGGFRKVSLNKIIIFYSFNRYVKYAIKKLEKFMQ